MKALRVVVAAACVLGFSVSLQAQTDPSEEQGLKPYDSWHGGDLDSISMTNGAMVLHIPLVSFPQRGNLNLNFSVYANTKNWQVVSACVPDPDPNAGMDCAWKWEPLPRGGYIPPFRTTNIPDEGPDGVYITSNLDWWYQIDSQVEPMDPNMPNQTLYDWSYEVVAPDGNVQTFAAADPSMASMPAFPLRSFDATGILAPDNHTIIMRDGTRFTYPSPSSFFHSLNAPTAVTDANGNQITVNPTTGVYTDTLNRSTPPPPVAGISSDVSTCPSGAVSATTWSVPGLNGGLRTFKFCYSSVTIYTDFGNATEFGPSAWGLLSAIVLPDLSMWTFSYDHYGDVTRVGFPTSGSITYEYAVRTPTCNGGSLSMAATSRTVDANDGTGGHKWAYTYAPGKTVVTSPDGNDTVHTIGNPISVGSCSLAETQVQYYQGSSSAGTLLKTVSTQYSGNLYAFSVSGESVAANVVPTQVTTAWPDGHTSKVVNSWDTGNTVAPLGTSVPVVFGSLMQRDEYDFPSGATLTRSTFNHYLWQDNSTYKNNNLISLPVSTIVTNPAGCELAKTSYGYDESYLGNALQGSGVTMQRGSPPAPVRGNRTSSSRWLVSNCTDQSAITSHTIPYDTGLPYRSYDPLNRMTQYTYDPGFYGAYVTQTNMPDTQMPDAGAPVVHHVISGDYDFNTGLLTRFTDENSQNFTYTYDNMLRLTQAVHPDTDVSGNHGQTTLNYPDPNTVTRQRLISAGVWEDLFTAKFDGLGRPYETLQQTPSGTIEVDTGYDSVGRVSAVSNPYYQGTSHAADPTYGVTTTLYDPLSRVTQTTKQDGSISQAQYNQTAGDGDTTVDCTIATDEAGKKREVCSDGLGRMVKVLEPNPASQATNATGWVTISGTEQSATSQPATSASVTVTIGGSDSSNSNTFCTTTCRTTTTKDSGTLSFTAVVGGVTVGASTSYNGSSTLNSLAIGLYNNFPTNSVVTISNPGTGNSFILTTVATGSAMNSSTISTSLTTSCVDSDTTVCGGVGWSMTLSGPNLAPTTVSPENFTGGQNASTVPDSGHITATINGTPYAVDFGSGDDSGTIAIRLASAISAGTWANATATGSTVNLTSKTAGTAGDYSLSASYTWNTQQFIAPSFTTSTSGAALSGALDASGLNNQPFVTVYQYDLLNNMIRADQKGTAPNDSTQWRTRTFTYDSLSHLITVQNPENGTVCYGIWSGQNCINGYDADGNLLKKTDARNIIVSYSYDALNRLTDKTYSDGTPQASYRYDYSSFLGQSFAYPVGREIATFVGSYSTPQSFTSYDPMGRVKQTTQCNPGVTGCKAFTAGYDLMGDLTSLAYPANGFTVTYGYDSAARLTGAADSSGVTYAQTPTFLASGAMQEFTSPNFNGNKFHTDYNSRLQPTEIWAGTGPNAGALFDKQYAYTPDPQTHTNNGNILTVTNVKDSSRNQTFTYDALNRLTAAQDAAHWSNVYTIDAWGNLTKKLDGPILSTDHLDTIALSNNQLSGYGYDAAGNVVNDAANRYLYDAENRIACMNPDPVTGQCNNNSLVYTYDADGRRINKYNGTNYWYGPGGAAMAETDAGGNWTFYIFFGGQRLARNVPQPSPNPADIKYYISDHLHSTAMFMDQSGALLDDNDFYPWGAVVPGVGQTTSNNTIKFTGKYRDSESQLDYFGARYYANATGRFMSPDWAAKPVTVPYAEFGDPQSLNLYSYVRNGPIMRIDPDGHNFAGWDGMDADKSGGTPPMASVDSTSVDVIESTPSRPYLPPIDRDAILRSGGRTCMCDDYHVDVKNHGRPHIDRVDRNGKLVGRYRPDGSGIPHKGKTPPPVPNNDSEKFAKAAEKVRRLEDEIARNNTAEANSQMDNILSNHPVPAPPAPPMPPEPVGPTVYYPCAGGPCDPIPVTPIFGPAPGTPPVRLPNFQFTPKVRFVPDLVTG